MQDLLHKITHLHSESDRGTFLYRNRIIDTYKYTDLKFVLAFVHCVRLRESTTAAARERACLEYCAATLELSRETRCVLGRYRPQLRQALASAIPCTCSRDLAS